MWSLWGFDKSAAHQDEITKCDDANPGSHVSEPKKGLTRDRIGPPKSAPMQTMTSGGHSPENHFMAGSSAPLPSHWDSAAHWLNGR